MSEGDEQVEGAEVASQGGTASTPLPSPSMSDFEDRKLQLERDKFEEEKQSNKRRLDIQEKEVDKPSPLLLAVLGGIAAVVGGFIAAGASIYVADENNKAQIALESAKHTNDLETEEARHKASMDVEAYKAEGARVIEAIRTGDADKAACEMSFFVDAGLIRTPSLRSFVDAYLASRKGGSGVGSAPSNTGANSSANVPNLRPECRSATKPSTQPITFDYQTDWMGGGHSQNEACERGIAENQGRYPGKVLKPLSSSEEQRESGGIFHVPQYRYYCKISVASTP